MRTKAATVDGGAQVRRRRQRREMRARALVIGDDGSARWRDFHRLQSVESGGGGDDES